jgi:ribosomal-protein-alanine N-acetyltransferase
VAPAPTHVPDLFAYGSKPEFVAQLHAPPFVRTEDAAAFLQSLLDDMARRTRLYWVMERAEDGHAIGTLGFLFPFSPVHGVAEFGYGVDPAVWGTGLFQEAARAVIDYGFSSLGLERIQAITRAGNVRSVRGVEKLGFRMEGQLASFYRNRDGGREDAVILGLLRPSD